MIRDGACSASEGAAASACGKLAATLDGLAAKGRLDAAEAKAIAARVVAATSLDLPALAQEKRVTEQIANLLRLAREEGDFVGEEAMHWFLKEQREEVSSMSDLLKLVERALESNILLAEEALARSPAGDQGVDPSAPPAAGGAL